MQYLIEIEKSIESYLEFKILVLIPYEFNTQKISGTSIFSSKSHTCALTNLNFTGMEMA